MIRRSAPVLQAAAALLCATTLAAQATRPDSARRDSVAQSLVPFAVRATRSSQNVFASPLAITRIERSAYAAKGGFGLNDAMAGVPGALVQSRYGTSDVRVTIRGFGARGAGDRSNAGTSRGVRVLLDGMPETEPDGRTAFDNIDLAAAEGIDVIRSNASALWGNAAGGVINVSTVPTADRPFTVAQVQSGSYGLQRYIAQMGAPIGNGGVAYASFVNTTFDGWRANSDARRVLVNTGIAAPVGENTRVRVHLTGANNLFHVPGPLNADQVAADPSQANATYNTRDERRYNRLARLGATVEHDIDAHQSVSVMAYINPKYLQRSERGTFRDFTRYHAGGNVSYNRIDAVSPTVGNRLTVGLDQAYQDGAILFYSLSATAGRGTTLADNKKEGAYNNGVFVEDEITLKDKLGLTIGARADGISYYYKSFIRPKTDASRTFSQVTPKLGVSWRFTPTHQVYASFGGGVEAPAGNETDPASTFGQDTVTALNPLLEPIRSFTYEAGTKHVMAVGDGSGLLESVSYDAAAYLTNVTNEVVPYRGGRFYFTAGKARRTGFELALRANARGGVRFEQALTLSHNTYEQYVVDSVHYGKAGALADYSGNKIVGVPDWFYSSNLTWAPHAAPLGLSVQAGLQGTGGYFADDANLVTVDASHILGASLRADRLLVVGDVTLKGFVSVENLTDKRWIGSAFLNPDVVNGKPLAYEPGMPRTVLVSFTVQRGR
jgi:iron complex outermembrane receptor protein